MEKPPVPSQLPVKLPNFVDVNVITFVTGMAQHGKHTEVPVLTPPLSANVALDSTSDAPENRPSVDSTHFVPVLVMPATPDPSVVNVSKIVPPLADLIRIW